MKTTRLVLTILILALLGLAATFPPVVFLLRTDADGLVILEPTPTAKAIRFPTFNSYVDGFPSGPFDAVNTAPQCGVRMVRDATGLHCIGVPYCPPECL